MEPPPLTVSLVQPTTPPPAVTPMPPTPPPGEPIATEQPIVSVGTQAPSSVLSTITLSPIVRTGVASELLSIAGDVPTQNSVSSSSIRQEISVSTGANGVQVTIVGNTPPFSGTSSPEASTAALPPRDRQHDLSITGIYTTFPRVI